MKRKDTLTPSKLPHFLRGLNRFGLSIINFGEGFFVGDQRKVDFFEIETFRALLFALAHWGWSLPDLVEGTAIISPVAGSMPECPIGHLTRCQLP